MKIYSALQLEAAATGTTSECDSSLIMSKVTDTGKPQMKPSITRDLKDIPKITENDFELFLPSQAQQW